LLNNSIYNIQNTKRGITNVIPFFIALMGISASFGLSPHAYKKAFYYSRSAICFHFKKSFSKFGFQNCLMRPKIIILLILTVLVTIVLMKNTEEVTFWVFGDHSISKLAILAIFFLIGVLVGAILARPRRKKEQHPSSYSVNGETPLPPSSSMSPEDEEYLRND